MTDITPDAASEKLDELMVQFSESIKKLTTLRKEMIKVKADSDILLLDFGFVINADEAAGGLSPGQIAAQLSKGLKASDVAIEQGGRMAELWMSQTAIMHGVKTTIEAMQDLLTGVQTALDSEKEGS